MTKAGSLGHNLTALKEKLSLQGKMLSCTLKTNL